MSPRSVALHVGRGALEVALPLAVQVDVLRKPAMPVLEDVAEAVARALDAPVGSLPLADVARGATHACVVVCDVTRPVPNGLLLRPIVERLLASGIRLEGITVLVATGLHRPNLGEELRALIGDDWVFERVRLENHDARDASRLISLGRTPDRGTPVALHRGFVEADVRIVTGLVEPHFMAGYSGGRKVVAPGIAGEQTIRSLHSSRFMGSPLASTANLQANPLHEEQLAIVEMVGPVFAVNTVIDERRALAFVNAGEIVASHAEAVVFARGCSELPCPSPYDLIVTGAGGHPLDANYYQTIKAMVTPLEVLVDGGTLLVASSCSEGIGSDEFREAQRRLLALGPSAFLEELHAKSLADIDEWETQMLLRATRIGAVHLWAPGLPEKDRDLIGVDWCDDIATFIDHAVHARPEARVAVIPEGPYVVPRLVRTR